jgi:hypothetical protein
MTSGTVNCPEAAPGLVSREAGAPEESGRQSVGIHPGKARELGDVEQTRFARKSGSFDSAKLWAHVAINGGLSIPPFGLLCVLLFHF